MILLALTKVEALAILIVCMILLMVLAFISMYLAAKRYNKHKDHILNSKLPDSYKWGVFDDGEDHY